LPKPKPKFGATLVFAVGDAKKKGNERYTKSQVGYISPIWGADPFGPISTKIGTVVGVDDVIIQSNFGFNILGVSDLQGVKMSIFPLLVIVTTVLPLPCSP